MKRDANSLFHSENYINDFTKQITEKATEYKDAKVNIFLKAFIEETGLLPSQCELVQQMKNNEIIWYFRKREKNEE